MATMTGDVDGAAMAVAQATISKFILPNFFFKSWQSHMTPFHNPLILAYSPFITIIVVTIKDKYKKIVITRQPLKV